FVPSVRVDYPSRTRASSPKPVQNQARATQICRLRRPLRRGDPAPASSAAAGAPNQSDPSDPEPVVTIRTEPHQILTARSRSNGPRSKIPVRSVFLLKSPWFFPDSTRGPELFKNNCSLTHVFARTPPSFPEIKPAVHPWQFCAS